MSYFLYILECADTTLYTGSTNDLERRLQQHNHSKRGARYTKARRPVRLLYTEEFPTRGDALRRESEIKSWRRGEKLALIQSFAMTERNV
ncbi:MAG: GIY-YIG nuclease family protein [Candidatus Pacebacteria bacterium]|nr:GIY-YIG nuclease family protein [Candidatus Paceibacterota bacterium]